MQLPKSLTTITSLSKILAGVLFITLPFLGFYMGMEYEKALSPDLSETTTPIVRTTPKPATDPTSDWKTYTNKKFQFAFKYPNNWKLQDYLENSLVAIDPANLITEKELLDQNIPPGVISIGVNMQNPTVDVYCWKDLPYYTLLSSKSIGNKDIKFIENYNTSENQSYYDNKYRLDYYFCSKEGTITHAILVVNQNVKDFYKTLFDQILSTYKFLDQEQTTSTPFPSQESSKLVIVTVKIDPPWQPEGNLTPEKQNEQRTAVVIAINQVLTGLDTSKVYSKLGGPYFAINADKQTLEYLSNHPLVISIQEDELSSPTN